MPDGRRDGIVVVVESVEFGLPTAQINARIADSVRDKVGALLARQDRQIAPDDVVVQVFGGAL